MNQFSGNASQQRSMFFKQADLTIVFSYSHPVMRLSLVNLITMQFSNPAL